ncbi:MAG: cyclic pyranopterin monophosphate synthase MoaC [Myxococcales bacterium]|nr:cyclic pyranopterin monophosphate synthase MoaC [Myxococcales bacterium]
MAKDLTHLDSEGHARMVDVGPKGVTERVAVARGTVQMNPSTVERVFTGDLPKGDVLAAARLAGIGAAKRTWELIPLCHPIALTSCQVHLHRREDGTGIDIEAETRSVGRTGVEMEALTAVSVAALTLYDMAKAVDRTMTVVNLRLVEKRGGASGDFLRDDEGR